MNAGLSFGVEEEFLVTDECGYAVPAAADVGESVAASVGFTGTYTRELHSAQIEAASGVHCDAHRLRADLVAGRNGLATALAPHRVVPIGWAPRGDVDTAPPAHPRHRRIHEKFGAVTLAYTACGCHVHVGVPDRDTAVAVLAFLRPWLPILVALGGNSPFRNGRDTGYDSWRIVEQSRFPTSGVPPRFADAAEYDACVARLVDCGALVDDTMSAWLARLSPRFPTVEVRAADVGLTVDDAVFQAVVTRGLVRSALAELARGVEAADADDRVLASAVWHAARHGLRGPAVDVRQETLVPGHEVAARLIATITDRLDETGDRVFVAERFAELRLAGTGADRLRATGSRAVAHEFALRDLGRDILTRST